MKDIRNRNFSREWFFRTSRSSGKGGQNVNKLSTKVELCFNINDSILLDLQQKNLIREKLGRRLSSKGLLRVISEKERSQLANKKNAIEKFYKLLEKALDIPEERIATKPTRASIKKRKTNKARVSEKKQRRKIQLEE